MAVIRVNLDGGKVANHPVDFDAIWQHYQTAGFLYPGKLTRLNPVLDQIQRGWPRLLAAPADVFQMHVACNDNVIVSSVSAFRDTAATWVIHHAVSCSGPWTMGGCIHSLMKAINGDERGSFLGMYFRPENRWSRRIARGAGEVHPPHLTSLVTRDYLTGEPAPTAEDSSDEEDPDVFELSQSSEVTCLATAAVGRLRATAPQLGNGSLNLADANARYTQGGLLRSRRVIGVKRDGVLAGLALCYTSSVPLNFSFLCRRVEILVHPDASDRVGVVAELARRALREARRCGNSICSLLIDPTDTPAAVAGGFVAANRSYSHALWARENGDGWPSLMSTFDEFYNL